MVQQQTEMIAGTVQSVIYQNPENGYAVLRVLTENAEAVTVVGTIPMTLPGERLVVTGNWGHHASYGRPGHRQDDRDDGYFGPV